jgi:2'-5' RNA ligase
MSAGLTFVAVAGRIRSFVALELPAGHRQALAAHLDECARRAPGFRWAEPDELHLTLRFLGHVEPDVLARIDAVVAGIRCPAFTLAGGQTGTFGSRSAPRVVWLGVGGHGLPACRALAAEVEAACRSAGLEAEERGFRPHVTLARARAGGERLPALPEPPRLEPWLVDEVVLFESRLQARPRYVALGRHPLRP